VVAACGTGKTTIGAAVSHQVAPGGRVLVIVPTLELLAQTARAYAAYLGAAAGVIGAVCSEQAATIAAAEIRTEMAHLHAGVTQDPAVLAWWLSRPGRITVLATYQSLPVIAAAHATGNARPWDLAVVDEAHRSAGRTDRAWHVIHDDHAIPAARRLYMTATPRIMSSEAYETTSMDNPAVFGDEAYRLTFAKAISTGLLADYRVAVSVVTDQEIAALAEPASRRIVAAGGPAVPAEMLAAQVALLKACAEWDLRRVITYHRRVARAHRFASTLLNAADLLAAEQKPAQVRAAAVDGSMRLTERHGILRHLSAPGRRTVVVSNARVLTEGVDVPELDAVMFADPRDSTTDVVQAVGRALRRGSTGGKVATIIVPILLGSAESPGAALEDSRFAVVWRVVRALRAHDERLADWLDERRVRCTTEDEHGSAGRLHDLPEWLTVRGTTVNAGFADALQVRLVEATTSAWPGGLAHAAAYHAEHGDLAVKTQHVTPGGYPLGQWISAQRDRRKAGTLTRDQVAALDALGMIWDAHASSWGRGLAAAAAYAAANGHLRVPQRHVTATGLPLGAWLSNQRSRRARGSLSRHRAAALEELGMVWDALSLRWEDGLAAVREFHTGHGHLDVPESWPDAHGVNLCMWLQERRQDYRDGCLAPGRVKALEELGIAWFPHDRKWERGLAALREFHASNGHAQVPRGYRAASGLSLATWINNKRTAYRAGQLPPDRVTALEYLGVIWDPHVQDWRDGLADCQEWLAAHGHLDIPGKAQGTRIRALGAWAARRRAEYHAGTLPPDRTAALEATGMRWDTPADRARRLAITALREFHAANGHTRIPATYVTANGVRLGQWMRNRMLTARTGGEIHPEALAALTECGVTWELEGHQARIQP
jgi:superfamily II DNA or RNA helicase